MLKKPITFEDFNGNIRTEDFYFNLTKAEVMTMEMGTSGGLAEKLQTIIAKQDAPSIMKEFEELILMSYGEKSPDGKHFVKNEDIRNSFKSTEAYSVLFMELAVDAEAASAFINAVVPNMQAEVSAIPAPPVK